MSVYEHRQVEWKVASARGDWKEDCPQVIANLCVCTAIQHSNYRVRVDMKLVMVSIAVPVIARIHLITIRVCTCEDVLTFYLCSSQFLEVVVCRFQP